MARKRWTIDKDGNAVQVGAGKTSDPTKDAAWDKVLDAEEKLLEDYAKKLITADELQQELKQLIQDSRKALGITVEQIEKRKENFDSGIDKFDKDKLGGRVLRSERIKRAKSLGLDPRKVENRESKIRGYSQKAKNISSMAGKASKAVGSATSAGKALGSVSSVAGTASKA